MLSVVDFSPLLKSLLHEYGGGGILSGFLHPILGLDHLLAMIAVGLVSVQFGKRAVWFVPALFVIAMAVGGILGILGIQVPLIEYAITGSVAILGIAILTQSSMFYAPIMVLVALFGLCHGNAHGLELPSTTNTGALTAAYVAGFLIATVGLHLIGVFLGMIAERRENGATIMRVIGGVLTVAGIYLLMQL